MFLPLRVSPFQFSFCSFYEYACVEYCSWGSSVSVMTDWLNDWLCRWGETISQNCGHQRAYCSSPGWYMSMESYVMMMPTGDNSWLVHQSSFAVLPAETYGASRRNGRRSENFAYRYLKCLKGSLKCRKILRPSLFTSHPRGRCAADFIALQNPSPRPGLNPRPVGPVASTLTTTPPRCLCNDWIRPGRPGFNHCHRQKCFIWRQVLGPQPSIQQTPSP
jgi:hypothetical protein